MRARSRSGRPHRLQRILRSRSQRPTAAAEGDAEVTAPCPASPSARSHTTVVVCQVLPCAAETVFAFHADVRNLPRLTPGPARILSATIPTSKGELQVIQFGIAPLAVRWHARIHTFDPPRTVVDQQERGPFRFWRHTHTVLPDTNGSMLIDVVQFALVPGRLGRVVDAVLVAPVVRLLFAERHRRTRRILRQTSSR